MKELETQERATLLLKVQRALDKARVNRDNFGLTICTVHLDDGYYVALCSMAMEAEVIQNDPFERDYADMTTFTFAELFPELEWEKGENFMRGEYEKSPFGEDSCALIQANRPSVMEFFDEENGKVEWDFRTPERAKRAAQSIADLLAEAGREEDQ
jgi:hypothetical protein